MFLSLSNCKSGKLRTSKEDVAKAYLMCLFKEGLPSKQLNRLGSVPHIFSKDLHVVGVLLRSMVGFLHETSKRYINRDEAIVARYTKANSHFTTFEKMVRSAKN